MGIEDTKEQQEELKKIIVEIGCGATPFPLFGKRKLKENETYIGIEPDLQTSESARKSLNSFKDITGVENFHVFEKLGEETGLPGNYADEIIVINVAGYRQTALRFDAIAKEAERILKAGGKVRIVETNTPYENPEAIISFFKNAGFKFDKKIN